MKCEQCDNDAPYEESHSMLVVLQKIDHSGYSWYQCTNGKFIDGHTYQHWHCSKEDMLSGVKECIVKHHDESYLQSVPSTQVGLHKHVFYANLYCKVCQSPLNEQAYRFCLTVATPVNYIADDSHDMLGEWCCSLEHARISAMKNLEGYKWLKR